jgi:hypothetical protein
MTVMTALDGYPVDSLSEHFVEVGDSLHLLSIHITICRFPDVFHVMCSHP